MERLAQLQAVATIISLVAVPIVVAVLGARFQKSIRASEGRTKSMELAISILKEPPGRSEQPGLRKWAIETLDVSSEVQLSDTARRELLAKPLLAIQPIQRNVSSGMSGFFPVGKDFTIGQHKAQVKSIERDSIVLAIDGNDHTIAINDSMAVPPENCVIHLLGVRVSPDAPNIAKEEKQPAKQDLAFMVWVCPERET